MVKMTTYKSRNGKDIKIQCNNTQETFNPHIIERFEVDFLADVFDELNIDNVKESELQKFIFDCINARIDNVLNFKDYDFKAKIRSNVRNRSTNEKAKQRYADADKETETTEITAKTDDSKEVENLRKFVKTNDIQSLEVLQYILKQKKFPKKAISEYSRLYNEYVVKQPQKSTSLELPKLV